MTKLRKKIGSILLPVIIVAIGAGLAAWKNGSINEANAASANQPEPVELVTTTVATEREHRASATAIGTVLASRSVTLRNEVSGTVRQVRLTPGAIVEAGAVLVALDISVEEAELGALEAQAVLAETQLARAQRMKAENAAPQTELDRARAERDIALAQIARTRAIISRKTIRAPFRARVGIADVHPGQYLNEGTQLTTLQGVEDAPNVDFSVSQDVAAGLRRGDRVAVYANASSSPSSAQIVAVDALVDAATRNALVRARIQGAGATLVPGAAVRVVVPVGSATGAISIPVSALRKGPAGDHVFVIAKDAQGKTRAHQRPVTSGVVLGDVVLIHQGLEAGEQVATTGSFKLRDAVQVATTAPAKSNQE